MCKILVSCADMTRSLDYNGVKMLCEDVFRLFIYFPAVVLNNDYTNNPYNKVYIFFITGPSILRYYAKG